MLDWGKGNLTNQKLFLITLSTKYMKQLEEKISSIRKPREIRKKNIVESCEICCNILKLIKSFK